MKLLRRKPSESTKQSKKIGNKLKRINSIKWVPVNIADLLVKFFNSLKNSFVYRSYWGRGSTYKQAVHLIIFIITIAVALSGVSYRIFGLNQASSGLGSNYLGNSGNVDLLQQGGSIQSLIAASPSTPFKINYYKVQDGDSLQSIADKFGVSKDTVKWSNMDIYSNYDSYVNDKVTVGKELKIPEISGVLYAVQDGDTFDSIVQKTSGDKFQTTEVNQLTADLSVKGRQLLLVPNGTLPTPKSPDPIYSIPFRPRPASGDCSPNGEINGVQLSNPLCTPDCSGYVFQRGLIYNSDGSLYHDGIDLSKFGGCTESAMCNGVVTYATDAGYYNGGYTVKINCGSGIETIYYHGDGNIWVKVGDQVRMGDPVMYMGCTGICTGTHLHFIIRQNGAVVDPAYYVAF